VREIWVQFPVLRQMKILGIETSCDETAVCILEAQGGLNKPNFNVLGNALYSQVKIHAEYGGVFPALAKREHAKNLVPLFKKVLEDASMYHPGHSPAKPDQATPLNLRGGEGELYEKLKLILEREHGLFEQTLELLNTIERPDIDAIAVTSGPGLEPALWVGINFARALGEAWNIPVIPTNHMEGHIVSVLLKNTDVSIEFPALALLISGGHTELVIMKNWLEYEIIGQTRDDAVGEAFDKVARLLGLPYPGGPQISKLAHDARTAHSTPPFILPRPMIKSDDYDFSFSGIKTAVLYALKKIQGKTPELDQEIKKEMSLEFENAVTEVLIAKVKKALEEFEIKTLILGGGVIANTYIREEFKKLVEGFPGIKLLIPEINLSTDNAVMIAMAAYLNISAGKILQTNIQAEGNLKL
jgi:N6-L-threonylcarbamoyladenine synthase